MMRAIPCIILIGTAMYVQFPGRMATASFTFRTVADTASSRYSSLIAPSINDNGTVAFLAGLDEGGTGIFMVSDGTTTTLADSNRASIKDFFGTLSINNSDSVAFVATIEGNQYQTDFGLFVGSNQGLTKITDSTVGDFSAFFFPSINNAGMVAFSAIFNGAGDGWYVASGGVISELVSPDDPIIGGGVGYTPINDVGTVAFVAQTSDGWKLFTVNASSSESEQLVSLPPTALGFNSSSGAAVGINNMGKVLYLHGTGAFTADDTGQVSFVVDAADRMFSSLYRLPVVDENGVFILDQTSSPSINDNGSVAFFAVDGVGKEGIYLTNQQGIYQPVVRAGDALGGSTVVRLVLSAEGLNNLGQVAFFAKLADGHEGIFVASIVPEPTSVSFAIVVLGLGLVATAKRRGT